MRTVGVTVVVILMTVVLSGCSALPSSVVVVGNHDGQLRVAVLRCVKPGPDRVILEALRADQDALTPVATRVGEWTSSDDRHGILTIDPNAPTGWTTEAPWSGPADDAVLYQADAQGGAGFSQPAEFSLAEVGALRPGEWLHVVSFSNGNLQRHDNETVRDLESFRRSWCADNAW